MEKEFNKKDKFEFKKRPFSFLFIGVLLGAAIVLGVLAFVNQEPLGNLSKTNHSQAKIIEFTSRGVNPKITRIKAGDTVVFVNNDTKPHWPASDVHPVHTAYPKKGGCIGSKFDACRDLASSETYSFTFTKPGAWRFHDHSNPMIRGTIIVEGDNKNTALFPGDTKLQITNEEAQAIAQELIDDGFLPKPEVCAQPRPYTIQGKRLTVANDDINFLISQDPAYPNGIDKNEIPIIPKDLTPEQREIYIDVLYGGTLDWKKVASNPQNSKALGGCIYCNAPAGAGGCFKKQVLRGLVYNLVKQDWGREEIRQEADFWMKCIFGPDPFLAWGIYYKKLGKDLNEVQSTVDKLSRYGRAFVLSQLAGKNNQQVFGSQACGVR